MPAGSMQWRLTPAETDNTYFMLESLVAPGASVRPHRHPEQECFFVLEGEVEFGRVSEGNGDGAMIWALARAGDSVQIPGKAWHGWRNVGKTPARLLITGPARLGHFFEEAGVQSDSDAPPGPPSPDAIKRASAAMAKYGHEFRP
jgi:quercetin dioxygenase-like cupin family protein